ncbi:MAG: HEAT repeat domain-containing protein [Gammaproteobacteria bacterium]|nr:HEAT repeat domain-containing protein [Gammaproteobacteria bacterium]
MHRFLIFSAGLIAFLVQFTATAEAALSFNGNTKTEQLVYLLHNSSNPIIRSRAAWAIGWYDHIEAASDLLSALEDEAPVVRQEAAEALRWVGDETAIPFLIHQCEVDENVEVRVRAVRSIGWIALRHHLRPRTAIFFLIDRLRQDTVLEVRVYAAKSLGMIKQREAGPALVEMLSDPEDDLRRVSAWALGEIEYVEAILPLLKRMGDEDRDVRIMVAYALSEIAKQDKRVVEQVGAYLSAKDKNIRMTVVWILGMCRLITSLPFLIKALNDEEEDVRHAAMTALNSYGV